MLTPQLAALLALACLGLLSATGRLRFLAEELPDKRRRAAAAALLFAVLAVAVFYPTVSGGAAADVDPAAIWFPSLFIGHAILVLFLFAWWRLRGDQQPLARFLLLDQIHPADFERGLWVGSMGWVVTIITTAVVASVISGLGAAPDSDTVPPLMLWLGSLPLWRKLIIIAVAMTVEEAFFRGFLQPRVGWIASSLLFALSHAGYGLPLLMVSVLAISLVIGHSLRQTGRLLPCIVAHGVFDAIQLLVIIPWALRMMEQ